MKSCLASRQEVHARYNFSCRCEACREEWPTEQFLVNVGIEFNVDIFISTSSHGMLIRRFCWTKISLTSRSNR